MSRRTPEAIVTEMPVPGLSPLEHMLAVMRDPTAEPARRDRMAIAAAQYVHSRRADTRVTKKSVQAKAAQEAGGQGSGWAGDLDPGNDRPQ